MCDYRRVYREGMNSPVRFPNDARIGHYGPDNKLIRELAHEDGRFVEPIDLKKGDTVWISQAGEGLPCLVALSTQP